MLLDVLSKGVSKAGKMAGLGDHRSSLVHHCFRLMDEGKLCLACTSLLMTLAYNLLLLPLNETWEVF